jgi:hypothetical protein
LEDFEVYRDGLTGQPRVLVYCATCGPNEVTPESLRRWEVDLPRFLEAVSRAAGVRGRSQELLPRRLWRLGTATWAQRPREVYFGRNLYGEARDAAVVKLGRHPKAVLILPTEAAADHWGSATSNLSVALDSTLALDQVCLCFDVPYVESRLIDGALCDGRTRTPVVRKRAGRGGGIDALVRELEKHIEGARDHAHAKKSLTGVPRLLPRPSKQALGRRVGLRPWQVTRCFQDGSAKWLNYLWDVANDLDLIMEWKGRRRPRKT